MRFIRKKGGSTTRADPPPHRKDPGRVAVIRRITSLSHKEIRTQEW